MRLNKIYRASNFSCSKVVRGRSSILFQLNFRRGSQAIGEFATVGSHIGMVTYYMLEYFLESSCERRYFNQDNIVGRFRARTGALGYSKS